MMFMASRENDFVIMFLGLETLSIATYVMAGLRRGDLKSNESAMKYFILGSFASAFLLYGMALIYGATVRRTSRKSLCASPIRTFQRFYLSAAQ
jgi:NADH-quinone oxidoreductase subunit N